MTGNGDRPAERPPLPDHYEILQVSREAHPMMITRAFRLLAAFYHPDNRQTGDEDAFIRVVAAHRVLSDPVRRAAYDREKFGAPTATFTGVVPPGIDVAAIADREPTDERQLRRLILDALYHVRRSRPYKPALPALAVAELFGRSMEEIQFSLWYLRGKKWIEMPDGSDIAITVAGVDAVEASEAEPAREAPHEPIALPAPRRTLDDPARHVTDDPASQESSEAARDRPVAFRDGSSLAGPDGSRDPDRLAGDQAMERGIELA
jgi:curved DNA-binding protein